MAPTVHPRAMAPRQLFLFGLGLLLALFSTTVCAKEEKEEEEDEDAAEFAFNVFSDVAPYAYSWA